MLHILLLLLKIVGIILLILLILTLFVLMSVLFVPLRYEAYAEFYDKKYVKGKVYWMLNLFTYRFEYDSDGYRAVSRILGIKLGRKKEAESQEDINNETTDTDMASSEDKVKDVKKTKEEALIDLKQEKAKEIEEQMKQKEADETADDSSREDVNEKKHIKMSIWDRIKSPFKKIVSIIKNIIDKIKDIFSSINKLKEAIADENNKRIFLLVKDQVIILGKHIFPRKIKGHIRFGTDDPSLTGKILGIAAIFMPVYKNNIRIVPDFNNVVLEGELKVRGRVYGMKAVGIAIRLIKDKSVRTLISKRRK